MKHWYLQPTRYLVDLIIYVLVFSCLIFLLWQDYLKLSGYILSILLIILPYYIYSRSSILKTAFNQSIVEKVQVVVALINFNSLLGSLAFYKLIWWYDLAIHFFNSALIFSFTFLLVVFFQKYYFNRVNLPFVLVGNFVIIIFLSFFWEFYESIIDVIFTSATMFGQFGEVYFDTLSDLGADLAGGLVASWLIFKYFYGYIINNFRPEADQPLAGKLKT